ncbi:LOW QUALITY PROTEIN: hypothetical protein RJ639_002010 [Escallonia herrerae]|uniref:J domain-containing protein n=1 Tax=Escallonia herrerae TaxID=1293975 RepID=A0AA88XB20_9ASTE|nr:LOW QUALITY PROTEIN: hypothetical protein RJ639_002010 [Escallonia herrerae]
MLSGDTSILKTHYDILGVKEDACLKEIRTSYKSTILNSYPDKMQKATETSYPEHSTGDRFLEIQRAWELLGNIQSLYDTKLRALRQDAIGAEDVTFEDLTVEDAGDVVEFLYQCRYSDYYSIDSLELGEMGFVLSRDRSTISLQSRNVLPAFVVLPCGSCSLNVRIFFNAANTTLQRDHHQ